MTSVPSSAVIKATQDTLGKFVKRPPLSEKLLKKPPFRFLHDIVTSVLHTNGFFEGLFDDDELISENVKDREAKIVFLNKVITVLTLTTGKILSVKPSKVISGQEPEKTNELLICLGQALEQNLSTREAVEKYKQSLNTKNTAAIKDGEKKKPMQKVNDSRSEKSITSKSVETTKSKNEKKESTPKKDKRDISNSIDNKKAQRDSSLTKKDIKRDNSIPRKDIKRDNSKSRNDFSKEKNEKSKDFIKDTAKKRENSIKKQNSHDEAAKPIIKRTDSSDVINTKIFIPNELKEGLGEPQIEPTNKTLAAETPQKIIEKNTICGVETVLLIDNDIPDSKKTSGNDSSITNAKQGEIKIENSESSTFHKIALDQIDDDNNDPSSVITEQSNTVNLDVSTIPIDSEATKANYQIQKLEHIKECSKTYNESHVIKSKTESEAVKPSTPAVPTLGYIKRPPSGRPPSARPGAPRLRDRHEEIFSANETAAVGKVNVIIENSETDLEDEEGNIVFVESELIQGRDNTTDAMIQNASGDHGHLVQQILDSQKEFNQTQTGKTEIEWEFGVQRAREASSQEVEQLRFNLQALSRAANPLAKLLDHIQEDVEVMRQELLQWTKTYEDAKTQLTKEKSETEQALQPLKVKTKQLDEEIADKRDKINDLKCIIHKNCMRIDKLLVSGYVQ